MNVSDQYSSRIIEKVFSRPGISRSDLVAVLELDKATITNLVSKLLKRGVLREASESGGRRSGARRVPLEINPGFGYVIGVEVQPEFVAVNALAADGTLLSIKSYVTQTTKDRVSGNIRDAIETYVEETGLVPQDLMGIGLGISGIVDPFRGEILFSRTLEVSVDAKIRIVEDTAAYFDRPVFVDNDARCCAYGQLIRHRKMVSNFLYVFCEFEDYRAQGGPKERISLGMSTVLDSKVHYGSNLSSGEFRAFNADPAVPGQFGVHSYDYFYSVKRDAKRRQEFMELMSRNIAFLVNFLDLTRVYFGGGIEIYKNELVPLIKRDVQDQWIYSMEIPKGIDVVFEDPNFNPVAYGAASLYLNHLYSGPSLKGFGNVGVDLLIRSLVH